MNLRISGRAVGGRGLRGPGKRARFVLERLEERRLLSASAGASLAASLSPGVVDLAPGQSRALSLHLTNTGTAAEDLALSVGGLPSGVSAHLAESSIALAPGAATFVTVSLDQTLSVPSVFTLTVTASAPQVSQTASAVVSVRSEVADVLSVAATSPAIAAGSSVGASARIFDVANATRSLQARLQVLDGAGDVVATAPLAPFSLSPSAPLATVNLGGISTQGWAPGLYKLEVSLLQADGSPLPGRSSWAPLAVGTAASGTVSTTPGLLAPGSSTVTTTITANGPSNGPALPNTVSLYFTEYNSPHSVNVVPVTYDGSSVTFGKIAPVTANIGADGLIFLPNGHLLTAEGDLTEIDPATGKTTTISGGPGGDHLALDPSGQFAWTSAQPGLLLKVPLDPLAPPTIETVQGDDTMITALAFTPSGQAFYTTGSPTGAGNFGTIDLQTMTTTRWFSDLPAARGILYDPFSKDIIIVGLDSVAQIDPATGQIVSSRDFSSLGISRLDQDSVDGRGDLYAADNTGKLLFIDYSRTGKIGDASDFVSAQNLGYHLDDVVPLVGPGSEALDLTVNHELPASGYTAAPSSIAPAADGNTASAIDWSASLPGGPAPVDQFQFQGTVTNMAPGEVRAISAGTTIAASGATPSGPAVPTIALPPVLVAAEHVITLAPGTQGAAPGGQATFHVRLTNPGTTDTTYQLAFQGPGGLVADVPSSVTVPAGQTVDVPLVMTAPDATGPITEAFTIHATSTSGLSDSVEGELAVASQSQPVPPLVDTAASATAESAAPQLVRAQWVGLHGRRKRLVLYFSAPLGLNTAEARRNYQLFARKRRHVRIKRALYDPATMSVTLVPARRINVRRPYVLIVSGRRDGALAGADGRLVGPTMAHIKARSFVLGPASTHFLARFDARPRGTPARHRHA